MPRSGAILVALELDESDDPLIQLATSYARALHCEIYLVHVVPVAEEEFIGMPKTAEADPAADPSPDDEPEVGYAYDRAREAERMREQHGDLQARQRAVRQQGLEVTALQLAGVAGEKIVAEARRLRAGLIVAGHRPRTVLGEMVFGSTSRDILSNASCPVLLVPQTG